MRGTRLAPVIALAFLAAHLPWLAPTPDDLDAVNFTLGIRDFDVVRHQPHPPGYPIYIALGKVTSGLLAAVPGVRTLAAGEGIATEARALALLSALFGALAAFPLFVLFRALESRDRRARAATVLTLVTPLVWFTAARPLSDIPGLAVALVAQALLVTAFRRDHEPGIDGAFDAMRLAASGRLIVMGALVAGLAIGLRSQTVWLTLPLLVVVLVERTGRDAAGAMLGAALAFGIGVVVWAVPLLVASGGPAPYARAVWAQAAEDFAGVEMVATGVSIRELAFALRDTFVAPWGEPRLAGVVLGLAAVGLVVMLLRARGALGLLGAMVVPYLVFHLAFHETMTVRYALPLVPAVVYLAVRGIDALALRAPVPVSLATIMASLALAVPALAGFARQPSPAFGALGDISRRLAEGPGAQPVLSMHYSFAVALRGERPNARVLFPRPRREWLRLVSYWSEGGQAPVWFLADPRRTDLAAIDHESVRLIRSYRWAPESAPFLRGTRPGDVDWYEVNPPRWFVAEGWALTPELGGVATLLGVGPRHGPITAYLRRGREDLTVLIGGRHVGRGAEPDARVTLSVDDRPIESWSVERAAGSFLRLLTLPAATLAGSGGYARLKIAAVAADESARPVSIAVEQFDAQPVGSVVYAFDRGWHELEYNPATGRLWRWTSDAADLRVAGVDRGVTIRLTGESPLRYFDRAPQVRVRAGTRKLATFVPAADFTQAVPVPADALRESHGTVTIETDQVFVPAERAGEGDRRRLGLRIYQVKIE